MCCVSYAYNCIVQDYLLPRTQTLRLAKSVLPPNTSIQKDAVLAIQKAATVFVNYVSSQYAIITTTITPSYTNTNTILLLLLDILCYTPGLQNKRNNKKEEWKSDLANKVTN